GGTVSVTGPAQTASFGVAIGGASANVGGPTTAATGTAIVSGIGAHLASSSGMAVGLLSNGNLTVSQGGTVTTSTLDSSLLAALSIGKQGVGNVTITDIGSEYLAAGHVYVGREGTAALTVKNGGSLVMSQDPTGSADLDIGGAGIFQGTIYVGG